VAAQAIRADRPTVPTIVVRGLPDRVSSLRITRLSGGGDDGSWWGSLPSGGDYRSPQGPWKAWAEHGL